MHPADVLCRSQCMHNVSCKTTSVVATANHAVKVRLRHARLWRCSLDIGTIEDSLADSRLATHRLEKPSINRNNRNRHSRQVIIESIRIRRLNSSLEGIVTQAARGQTRAQRNIVTHAQQNRATAQLCGTNLLVLSSGRNRRRGR